MTARWLRWERVGNELYRWAVEDDRYYRVHVSLNEAALIARNKAIAAQGGGRKMEWARPFFSAPAAVMAVLEKRYPGLASGDFSERASTYESLSRNPDYKHLFIGKP